MYLFRTSGYNRPPTFGRHGAHKHNDSMGEVNEHNNLNIYKNNLFINIIYRLYTIQELLLQ